MVARLGGGVGLGGLIPGYRQWSWGQRGRALVLGGSFAAALAVGLFAWGSAVGVVLLGFAFAAHVASVADAIRQAAFPGFGRWVPTATASVGLGLGGYAPALALATALAWPGGRLEAPGEAYLVNRWAYRAAEPKPGDWVWYDAPRGRGFGVGRLVARAGQDVEWSDGRLLVDGKELSWSPVTPDGPPRDLAFRVPTGQVLIAPAGSGAAEATSCGLRLLPRPRLVGRAWARLYPVWDRRFLF